MLFIQDDTTFIDINRSNYFCCYYTSAGTMTSGTTVLSGDTIYSQLLVTDKLSKQTYTYYNTDDDVGGTRFFRLYIDLTDLNNGTYSYELKLMNFTTLVYDSYEVGILIREFENKQDQYTYDDNDDNSDFVFVY